MENCLIKLDVDWYILQKSCFWCKVWCLLYENHRRFIFCLFYHCSFILRNGCLKIIVDFLSWLILVITVQNVFKFRNHWFFSSPELKAQVSFSDQICPLSVVVVVIFSHFHLLRQNHWANLNQTWHKAFLDEGDSSLFKRRTNKCS